MGRQIGKLNCIVCVKIVSVVRTSPRVREKRYNFKYVGQRRLYRDSELGVLSLITEAVRMWNESQKREGQLQGP